MDISRSICLVPVPRLRRILVHEARILEHVCPFTAGSRVAMLQVLAEVIGAIKLLGRVAFPKFMHLLQVSNTFVPVLVGRALGKYTTTEGTRARGNACASKLVSAVAADVSLSGTVGRLMKSSVIA